MKLSQIKIQGKEVPVYSCTAAVVGSGAAGLACALHLSKNHVDVALVTEGMNCGTSRNTGSDKQTYYKLGIAGEKDSVTSLAQTLFDGGCMDGDAALVQAALSPRCFFQLVDLGVPFPHDEAGMYVGYKTDHDPARRATSCGPLTSHLMTKALQAAVEDKKVPVLDGFRAIDLWVEDGVAKGLVCLQDKTQSLALVLANSIVLAVGGPAGLYEASVYPPSHFGGSGFAFARGAMGVNLTEWQYGLASTKFRWNLSGTYMQVLPRYISTDENGGDVKEFLNDAFDDASSLLLSVFLKGYQWPFDAAKACGGSSIVDLIVYRERYHKGRRVFLDFMQNPSTLEKQGKPDFSVLPEEAHTYLMRSGATQDTPFERLKHMNPDSIELYRNNGIDLETEWLEMDLCAQHHNGGLYGDAWKQTNIEGLFAIGECGGTFGVRRPGGSALNDTQVGAIRSAQWIAQKRNVPVQETANNSLQSLVEEWQKRLDTMKSNAGQSNVIAQRNEAQHRMSMLAGPLRTLKGIEEALEKARQTLASFEENTVVGENDLLQALMNRDMLQTQIAVLGAMADYIRQGGGSRGSYLVLQDGGRIPAQGLEVFSSYYGPNMEEKLQETTLEQQGNTLVANCNWRKVRPVPQLDDWFEQVWAAYRKDAGVRPM